MTNRTKNEHIYTVVCVECGRRQEVLKTAAIRNAAGAVRSIGWSYGKDGTVLCRTCRTDNYKWVRHYV